MAGKQICSASRPFFGARAGKRASSSVDASAGAGAENPHDDLPAGNVGGGNRGGTRHDDGNRLGVAFAEQEDAEKIFGRGKII